MRKNTTDYGHVDFQQLYKHQNPLKTNIVDKIRVVKALILGYENIPIPERKVIYCYCLPVHNR